MGFEPMNTGFADQRVSHFAIGACNAEALFLPIQTAGADTLRDGEARTGLRLRRCPQVGLYGLVAGENLVRLFVGDGTGDDDVVALLPVCRRRDAVL